MKKIMLRNIVLSIAIMLILTNCSTNKIVYEVDKRMVLDSTTEFSALESSLNLTGKKVSVLNLAMNDFKKYLPQIDSLFLYIDDSFNLNIELLDRVNLEKNVLNEINKNLHYKKPLESKQVKILLMGLKTDYLVINYFKKIEPVLLESKSIFHGVVDGFGAIENINSFTNGMASNTYIYQSSALIQSDEIKGKAIENKKNQENIDYRYCYISAFFKKYYLTPVFSNIAYEWKLTSSDKEMLDALFAHFLARQVSITIMNKKYEGREFEPKRIIRYFYSVELYEKNIVLINKLQEIGIVNL